MTHRDADSVATAEELATFVLALRADLLANEDAWENPTLERFLEALAAYLDDLNGWLANRGEPVPAEPTWKLVVHVLEGARLYD